MTLTRKLVGRPLPRLEDPRLLRGDGRYLADTRLPGMVHAAFLRSPLASARIESIDTRAARSDPRSIEVITALDLPEFSGLPCFTSRPGGERYLQPVLARDVVRYVGEPVAVVVAATRHDAEDLLELIEVRWAPLPAVTAPDLAIESAAPLVHGISNVVSTQHYSQGDAGAIDRAQYRLRRRFRLQRHAGIPLETRGVVADWDARRETVTVTASTQCPHVIRDVVGSFLGMPPTRVHVLVPDVGGAFGTKNNVYPEELAIPFLAHRLRRPVKWIEDRAEHLASSTHGREQIHDVEIAYEEDGTIVGLRDEIIMPCGAYTAMLAHEELDITLFMLRGPYRIPNYDGRGTLVTTNTTPMAPFRAVGHCQAVFVMERLVEAIAHERGVDPVELRLRNMLRPDELPSDRGIVSPHGAIVYDSGDYPKALEQALALCDYPQLVAERARLRAQNQYLGIGIACYVQATSIGPFETGITRVDPSGRVVVSTGTTGSGQGHPTAFAQIAAEELGVAVEDVQVIAGDTDLVRTGLGAFASRSAAVAGTAISRSAASVRQKVIAVAAHLLEASPDDLVLEGGFVQVAGDPEARVSLADVAAAVAPGAPLPPGVTSHELQEADHFSPAGLAFAYGTQIAVVVVDAGTGEIRVRQIALVHDSGPMLNPAIVKGQLYGGIVLGLGTALLEEIRYTDTGQPPASFTDYLLPAVGVVDEIRIGHMQTPSPHNPLGVKGVGESGVIGAPAAVANAVADALAPFGVDVTSLPLDPASILDLIHDA